MIEAIHKHLLSELDRAGRSDTVFILAGVAFNVLVLFVNWIQASQLSDGRGNFAIFLLFMIGTVVVSVSCLLILLNSRKICLRCHEAMEKIYRDNEVSQYIPEGMGELGNKRFILSFVVVAGTGLLAVLIPAITVFNP